MLEYLKKCDSLFPFYPMVELLSLREERLRLRTRADFFEKVVSKYNDNDDDNTICSFFTGQTIATQLLLLDEPLLYDLTMIFEDHVSLTVADKLFRYYWNELDHEWIRYLVNEDREQEWHALYRDYQVSHYLHSTAPKNKLKRFFQAWKVTHRFSRIERLDRERFEEASKPKPYTPPVFLKRVFGQ